MSTHRKKGPLKRAFKHGSRWLALRLIPLFAFIFYFIARTWRVRLINWDGVRAEHAAGRSVIYSISHGRMLPCAWVVRKMGVHILISEHFDGEIITRVLRCFGFGAARGSATRGGAAGVRELVRLSKRWDLAVTPDGPKGPFLCVKPGVPYLASRTGLTIITAGIAADWRIKARSWDEFLLPLPFARVFIVLAPPRRIPEDADDARLEVERAEIEKELLEREATAEALAQRPARERARERTMVSVPPSDELVDVGGWAWTPRRSGRSLPR